MSPVIISSLVSTFVTALGAFFFLGRRDQKIISLEKDMMAWQERHMKEADARDQKIDVMRESQNRAEVAAARVESKIESLNDRMNRLLNFFESGKYELRRTGE